MIILKTLGVHFHPCFQTHGQYWELEPALDCLLSVSTSAVRGLLEDAGVKSLGI